MGDSTMAMAVETLAGGWARLDGFLRDHLGWGLAHWFAALIVLAVLARLIVSMREDRLRFERRRALLHSCRDIAENGRSANREMAEALEQTRAQQQGFSWVAGRDVSELANADGIGEGTITNLRVAGFRTLGDLWDADPRRAWFVGESRGFTIRWTLDQLLKRATAAMARRERGWARDPDIDRLFDDAQEILAERNELLGEDVAGLVTLFEEVEAEAAEYVPRPLGAHVAGLADGAARTLERPGRAVSTVVLLAAHVAVAGAVPWLLYAWRLLDLDTAATASAATATIAIASLVWFYFVIPRAFVGWARTVDPTHFDEQRLQLHAFLQARILGVEPPEVRIAPFPTINARAIGSRGGPSLVILHRPLVEALDDDSVRSVLAHELGHLRGDHSRLGMALGSVGGPYEVLGRLAGGFYAGVTFAAFAQMVRTRRGPMAVSHVGKHTLVLLPIWALALGSLVFTALIRLAFRALAMGASRQDEYDADRASAEAVGAELTARTLDIVAHLDEPSATARGALATASAFAGELQPGPTAPGYSSVRGVERWLDAVGSTHPPMQRRIQALERPGVKIGDWGLAVGRGVSSLALVVALAMIPAWVLGAAPQSAAAERVSSSTAPQTSSMTATPSYPIDLGAGPEWWCLCWTQADGTPATACRRSARVCRRLQRKSNRMRGEFHGLVRSCVEIGRTPHPEAILPSGAWEPSARSGAWWAPGVCLLE